jgi:DNA transposition AAA+ family ATPase
MAGNMLIYDIIAISKKIAFVMRHVTKVNKWVPISGQAGVGEI